MKRNNIFFLFVMITNCGSVVAQEGPPHQQYHGQGLVVTQSHYQQGPKYPSAPPELHYPEATHIGQLDQAKMMDLPERISRLEKKFEDLLQVTQQQSDGFKLIEVTQAEQQKQITQLALNQTSSSTPQNITINTSGGNATASSNPITTQEANVNVENNSELFDSKMKLRSSVMLSAMLFGLVQGGPDGGVLAGFTAAGMLYAVHTVKNKIAVLGGFTSLTAAAFAAMMKAKDKDAIKAAGGLFVMSFCGTILVGVLAP